MTLVRQLSLASSWLARGWQPAALIRTVPVGCEAYLGPI